MEGMQHVGGVWLPAGETHLVEWMRKRNHMVGGRLTYQYHKLEAAVGLCKRRRRAIDVGAHCGLWSTHLADMFASVDAFEPVALHRECFEKNVVGGAVTLHAMALGEETGSVSMKTAPSSSGDTTVGGGGDIPLRRLDDVLPEADDVDFIKIDVEGYEVFVLRGAVRLITRCRPVIIVESKPGKAPQFGLPQTAPIDFLRSLGYVLSREIGGDFIMVTK